MSKSTSTNTSFADFVPKGYRVTLDKGDTAPSEAARKLNLFLHSEAKSINHVACKGVPERDLTIEEKERAERCRKDVVLSYLSRDTWTLM
jgi:hypothetical protein